MLFNEGNKTIINKKTKQSWKCLSYLSPQLCKFHRWRISLMTTLHWKAAASHLLVRQLWLLSRRRNGCSHRRNNLSWMCMVRLAKISSIDLARRSPNSSKFVVNVNSSRPIVVQTQQKMLSKLLNWCKAQLLVQAQSHQLCPHTTIWLDKLLVAPRQWVQKWRMPQTSALDKAAFWVKIQMLLQTTLWKQSFWSTLRFMNSTNRSPLSQQEFKRSGLLER